MIRKHVSEALRRQDWNAVALEFVLLVVGILLAVQINDWVSDREGRAERASAGERLLREAEETVAYLRSGVNAKKHLIDDLDYTLSKIQQDTWRSADEARMTNALERIHNAGSIAPPSSVYDDLVASGTFGNLGDAKLRTAIANYRSRLLFSGRFVDYFRQRMPHFEDRNAFQYIYAREPKSRMKLQIDFPALKRDSRLQGSLALVADGQLQMLKVRQLTLEAATTMCLELGRTVGRPCDHNRPVPKFD